MSFVSQDPGYGRLKDHLIASTGLAFYADRDQLLTEVIGGRLSALGLRGCSSYAEFLAAGHEGNAEMDVLIAKLTIGETFFFRGEEQFDAIRDVILPDILDRKQSSRQLRIWSAGCATGAEPYSLAILLAHELANRINGWQVEICATDLNRDYLTQAAAGKFRPRALGSLSDERKRECFSNEGPIWTIHPRYKQWISFHYMNLVESDFSALLTGHTYFDLILCRNVMIYFTPEVNQRLVGQFHRSLEEGGWLVVGATEHNQENYKEFRAVTVAETEVYQKLAPPAELAEMARETAARSIPPAPPLAKQPAKPAAADLEGLRQLVDRGGWRSAVEYGQELLTQDKLNPSIHFYLALVFESLGRVDESERSLRQAIYLDRNFALAHYHLGLALKRDRQIREADRSFGNVLKVLAGLPDDELVTAGAEVTTTGLRELAKMHLQRAGE